MVGQRNLNKSTTDESANKSEIPDPVAPVSEPTMTLQGHPLGRIEGPKAPQTCFLLALPIDIIRSLIPLISDRPIQLPVERSVFADEGFQLQAINTDLPVFTNNLFNLLETCKLIFDLISPFVRWQDPDTLIAKTAGFYHFTRWATGGPKNEFFDESGYTIAYHLKEDGSYDGTLYYFPDKIGAVPPKKKAIEGTWHLRRERCESPQGSKFSETECRKNIYPYSVGVSIKQRWRSHQKGTLKAFLP